MLPIRGTVLAEQFDTSGTLPAARYGHALLLVGVALFAAVTVMAAGVTVALSWWWALPGAVLAGLILLAGRRLSARSITGRSGAWLAAIVVAAAAARFACVAAVPYEPLRDFEVYHHAGMTMARTWMLGIPAGDEGGTFRCFFPPGQVFTLGVLYRLFDDNFSAAQLLNVIYGALTVVGVWYLADRLFGRRASLTAAALAAVMPSAVLGCVLIGAEVPQTFWMVLALCFYIGGVESRHGKAAALAAGASLGVASLIRPTFVLVSAVMAAHLLIVSPRRVKALACAAMLMAGACMVVLPWTWRNYRVTGGYVLISSNGGINLYSGNNDDAKGDYTDSASRYVYANGPDDLTLQRVGFEMGKRWIASHPLGFLDLAARKFAIFWVTDKDIAWWSTVQPTLDRPELGTPAFVGRLTEGSSSAFYCVCLAAATVGMWRRRRWLLDHRGWLVFLPIVLYFNAVHLVFEAQAKYHFPLMPMLCVLAAVAVADVAGGAERTGVEGGDDAQA
jgi:4-amino-4-deoxy-L-arabinose transferase-like glycosyltransferase